MSSNYPYFQWLTCPAFVRPPPSDPILTLTFRTRFFRDPPNYDKTLQGHLTTIEGARPRLGLRVGPIRPPASAPSPFRARWIWPNSNHPLWQQPTISIGKQAKGSQRSRTEDVAPLACPARGSSDGGETSLAMPSWSQVPCTQDSLSQGGRFLGPSWWRQSDPLLRATVVGGTRSTLGGPATAGPSLLRRPAGRRQQPR